MRVRSNRPPGARPVSSSGRQAGGASASAVLIAASAQAASCPLSQAETGLAKPSLSRLAQTLRGGPRALEASRRIRFPCAGSAILWEVGRR